MYLLTAVADLVRICQPASAVGTKYWPAVHRLWLNMIEQKSYVTGGIGAIKKWEGFGIDYFLPQGTDEGGCYAETCAAIGVMMLAERLLQVSLLIVRLNRQLFTSLRSNWTAAILTSWSYVSTMPS